LFFIFINNSQSHQVALEIASKDMSILENRNELYENEETVKKGLLNSYLNKYRYISSTENNHIEEIYKDCLKNDFIAEKAQNAYSYLMSPFLYKGDRENDPQIAKELYESNFDIGIQKDNKEEILKALLSTWDRDGAEAGVLNVNQEKVLLLKQEITIKENQGVASIEVHEVYKNVTFDRQEIFYYFKIPSNTVVNGLWLSDNDSIPKKYSFKVSPRGAAQQVYKEEVRKRVDPSLLEQVGPFQYRLRAFPILPKRKEYKNNKTTISEGENFHLWIRFKTIISSENDWKMPQLIEKRNVYWNDSSIRYLNGKKLTTEGWLPKSIKPKADFIRNMFIETLNDSVSICVKEKIIFTKNYLKDKRISFVIDGSYSMRNHLDNLKETLNYFSNQHISNQSKLYIFNRESSRNGIDLSIGLDLKMDDFYGTISNIEVLHKFHEQRKDQDYIIYLTDEGGYDETIDSLLTIDFNSPLIVFHLNNSIAPVYADAFLESIQNSKGFICEDLKNINNRLYVNSDDDLLSYQDGIVYERVDSNGKESNLIKDIVANKYINNAKNEGNNRIDWLDEIHRIAVENKIVTKFSSMIVLVNDIQKKRLEELEKNKDRFDREKEDGEENLTNPSDLFSVNATPEPEEWVLITLIVLYVFYYYRKKVRVEI
jgi:putative PEP-CTERM system integral membrane protein